VSVPSFSIRHSLSLNSSACENLKGLCFQFAGDMRLGYARPTLLFPIASEPLLPAGNINENSAAFSVSCSADNRLPIEKLTKSKILQI
jgi:hypothetical protein